MSDVQLYMVDCEEYGTKDVEKYLKQKGRIDDSVKRIRFNKLFGNYHNEILYTTGTMLMEIMQADISQDRVGILSGSGHLHHLTYGFCKKMLASNKPYTIVHIDNHPDGIGMDLNGHSFAGTYDSYINCGNFYPRLMLDDKRIESILYVTDPGKIMAVTGRKRTDYRRDSGKCSAPELLDKTMEDITTDNVYITVDLDVLSSDHVKTDYGNGTMELEFLLSYLDGFRDRKNVIGADICGITRHNANERSLETYESVFLSLLKLLEG